MLRHFEVNDDDEIRPPRAQTSQWIQREPQPMWDQIKDFFLLVEHSCMDWLVASAYKKGQEVNKNRLFFWEF